jgi:hypothetical protein
MNKYTTIQLKKETHSKLQEYCNQNGYKLSGLVEKLILREIQIPKNVLRVH